MLGAKRAIYGLRTSPTQWENLRDSTLCGATLVSNLDAGSHGRHWSDVLLVKVQATAELVGIICVIVQ